MAGRADPSPNEEFSGESTPATLSAAQIERKEKEDRRKIIMEHCAKLYGQGFTHAKVARLMINHLVPNDTYEDGLAKPLEQRLSQARAKLRRWWGDEKFRDMVYASAVVEIDKATPGIIQGVIGKAKRGRVDAARFALELSGRHNPKGDSAPAQVIVAINGIARPQREIKPGQLEVDDAGHVILEEDG